MISPFGPTGSNCLMPPPKRLPIPAAMTTNVTFFICALLHQYFIYIILSTSPLSFQMISPHTKLPVSLPLCEPFQYPDCLFLLYRPLYALYLFSYYPVQFSICNLPHLRCSFSLQSNNSRKNSVQCTPTTVCHRTVLFYKPK